MLASILIILLINFLVIGTSFYIVDNHYYASIKQNRQELVNGITQETKGIFKRKTDNKIDYINNQYTKDSIFSFNIFSDGNFEYKLKLNNYDNFSNPLLYVYIYESGTTDSILDNVKNDLRNYNDTLGDTIDLDNIANGFYKLTPDVDNSITIRGTSAKHSLQFFFINDEGKGINRELKKIEGDNVTINNILRQSTKLNIQEIETYFQGDGLNGIFIFNN